jgi:glucosamine--fructose-6-phosphate aminotransferase (isomerizing)
MIDSVERTPVICIVVKDNFYDDMLSAYSQAKSRNATVILLTNCKESMDTEGVEHVIEFPNKGLLSSFFAVFAGQLIAYYLAVERGYNPDKPRQLSKEITTK